MKKWLPLALALFMVLGLLAGCGGPKPAPGTSNPSGTGEGPDPVTEKRYDREYRMLTELESFYYHAYTYDLDAAPQNFIDTAIYQRENYMMAKYGIDMVRIPTTEEAAYTQFTTAMSTQAYLCDVACLSGIRSVSAAVSGWLLDLNKRPELNLSAEWWDQRIQEEYRIGDHLFTLEGEFNFIDDLRTYVTVYNDYWYKELKLAETYGTPYELVDSGDWTYENMLAMMNVMGHRDSNHDDVLNEKDTWAMVSETIAPYYFFLGSGNKFINNQSGTLILAFDESSQASWKNMLTTMSDLMGLVESEHTICAGRPNDFTVTGTSELWTAASNIFMYDRALFRTTSLSAVIRVLDMESDYGVLPIPAYAEGQDGYYCFVNPVNHYPLSIPFTAYSSIQEVAEMTELLAYHSYNGADSLNAAFYEVLVENRLCRTKEDRQMLKLIFSSKTYDLDAAMKVTGAKDIISDISKTESYDSLERKFEEIYESAETNMKKMVSDLITNLSEQEEALNITG